MVRGLRFDFIFPTTFLQASLFFWTFFLSLCHHFTQNCFSPSLSIFFFSILSLHSFTYCKVLTCGHPETGETFPSVWSQTKDLQQTLWAKKRPKANFSLNKNMAIASKLKCLLWDYLLKMEDFMPNFLQFIKKYIHKLCQNRSHYLTWTLLLIRQHIGRKLSRKVAFNFVIVANNIVSIISWLLVCSS